MSSSGLREKLDLLDARSKSVTPSGIEELQGIQSELDDLFDNLARYKNHDEYEYFFCEIQARLHYMEGRLDEAEKFCDEAIGLVGAEYPDAKWLKHMISKEQQYKRSIASNRAELKDLRDEKNGLAAYLTFAIIGLFIFVPLFLNSKDIADQRSEMISSCISEIDEAHNVITSMNDSFEEISSEASNTLGGDYYELESSLDDISTSASGAGFDVPSSDCSLD